MIKRLSINCLLVTLVTYSGILQSDEGDDSGRDLLQGERFAVGCQGDTELFLIEPAKKAVTKNEYCGDWQKTEYVKNGSTIEWYSFSSPRWGIEGYNRSGKMRIKNFLNLESLEYSWDSTGIYLDGECKRGCKEVAIKPSEGETCDVISWEYAIQREEELFC